MELTGRVYVGDVGTLIRIDMQEELTNLTEQYFSVKKPDGNIVSWGLTAISPDVVTINGNYLEYITQSGDIDISGSYLVQPKGIINAWEGSGVTAAFMVYELFK